MPELLTPERLAETTKQADLFPGRNLCAPDLLGHIAAMKIQMSSYLKSQLKPFNKAWKNQLGEKMPRLPSDIAAEKHNKRIQEFAASLGLSLTE